MTIEISMGVGVFLLVVYYLSSGTTFPLIPASKRRSSVSEEPARRLNSPTLGPRRWSSGRHPRRRSASPRLHHSAPRIRRRPIRPLQGRILLPHHPRQYGYGLAVTN